MCENPPSRVVGSAWGWSRAEFLGRAWVGWRVSHVERSGMLQSCHATAAHCAPHTINASLRWGQVQVHADDRVGEAAAHGGGSGHPGGLRVRTSMMNRACGSAVCYVCHPSMCNLMALIGAMVVFSVVCFSVFSRHCVHDVPQCVLPASAFPSRVRDSSGRVSGFVKG